MLVKNCLLQLGVNILSELSNAESYHVVNINNHWHELRPLLDNPRLVDVHENAVKNWMAAYPKAFSSARRRRWTLASALAGKVAAPWEMTTSDFWMTEIDRRVEDAMKDDNEDAYLLHHVQNALSACWDSTLVTGAERRALNRIEDRVRKCFEPHPDREMGWWFPRHSCHTFAQFALSLARLWRPMWEWDVVSGDCHSTVVCHDHLLCFDVLLYDSDDVHPVKFALCKNGERAKSPGDTSHG